MTDEERFMEKYSRIDFDKQGFSQARVWARVVKPGPSLWRRRILAGACGVFLFAAGFGVSRWVSVPAQPVQTVPAASAPDYFLLCVKGGGRSTGYCCKKHSFYGEEALPSENVFLPHRRECTQSVHPDLPSFYDLNSQNC